MFIPDEEQKKFLERYVFTPLGIKDITPENIDDVYDFIVENFEVPYVQDNMSDSSAEMIFIMKLLDEMSGHMEWA